MFHLTVTWPWADCEQSVSVLLSENEQANRKFGVIEKFYQATVLSIKPPRSVWRVYYQFSSDLFGLDRTEAAVCSLGIC